MNVTSTKTTAATAVVVLALGGVVLAAPAHATASAPNGTPTATGPAPLSFEHVSSFGETGDGLGKFQQLRGINHAGGFSYVTDSLSDSVEWYGNGQQHGFSLLPDPVGALDGPYDIAVRGLDTYVADAGNARVVRLVAGTATAFGTAGQSSGQFNYPTALDIGNDDTIYVLDSDNHRVQQFTADGDFVRHFGGQGDGPGQLKDGYGLAVAPDGSVFVSDRTLNRVTRFSDQGGYLGHWDGGSGAGALDNPVGIDVGPDGKVYVVDEADARVKVFSASGEFRVALGAGVLNSPWGVDVSEDGTVRVTDRKSDTIETFRPVLAATSAPKVSGPAKVGSVLSASAGEWPVPGVALAYQWLRNGTAVSGATASTYKLTALDAGAKLAVRVTASRSDYPAASSAASSAVQVAKLKAKVTTKLAKKKIKVGKRAKVTLRVKVAGIAAPQGTLVIRAGKKVVKTVKLKAKHAGKRTVKLPKLKKGKHKIKVTFKATQQITKSKAKAKTLRVVR